MLIFIFIMIKIENETYFHICYCISSLLNCRIANTIYIIFNFEDIFKMKEKL